MLPLQTHQQNNCANRMQELLIRYKDSLGLVDSDFENSKDILKIEKISYQHLTCETVDSLKSVV